MKFTTYQQAVEPNVMKPPAVRRTGDVNAYGAGGEGYGKMAAALGQVNKVLAQEQEDRDTADVMKACNEIMTSLTEQLYGENGLFVTGVGENAKGLIERTTAAIHKTYDEISKNYNGVYASHSKATSTRTCRTSNASLPPKKWRNKKRWKKRPLMQTSARTHSRRL